ncbi:hypothetical protein JCM17846_10400 [Iodidimonas nitroreducens]|uniref:Peptidase M28 domain-containing protein n=1 Tax=Iodidimonas nitroreducens TaxID=1236968 RepID=A0A5A7N5E0_9PROT|nr:M28 family metallopeptidase [Iodidimonas nitroreducens]GAK32306.1 N-acetylated-alpha-linked acidic dipeptidase-like protein [alpha proteobacterium Q-1]GER03358.1 hypothetical protein JCM17846_10400 [Iodidimonas nitroreducens]
MGDPRDFKFIGLCLAIGLAACGQQKTDEDKSAFSPAITAEDLAAHSAVLASDDFGGRPPSGPMADKTITYLVNALENMGLEPAFGDSFTQKVPLVSIEAAPDAVLRVAGDAQTRSYAYGSDMMVWTTRVAEHMAIKDSELVFVGYGINAPEYGWNDYEGIDMTGKTAIILVNDPGFATQNPDLFDGNSMTYYGRWTYKYEEAARQGAEGAIIIHQTAPAAYPWSVVENSWTGPQFDLVRPDGNAGRVAIEGWVQERVAQQIFADAGLDFDDLTKAAQTPGFKPMTMGLTASVAVKNSIETSQTVNVGGVLKGASHPDEAVIYTAHWDHLGEGPAVDGDKIYNGAADNATGIATVLEVAQKMAAAQKSPRRTVLFLFVGAEEQGLLGAYHYADNPITPLGKTAALINTDVVLPLGEMKDITVIGLGSSQLEEILADNIAVDGRSLTPYPNPEQGFYFRSDHFALAKRGVPALYLDTGTEHITKGRAFVAKAKADYVAHRYHKPSDEIMPDWDYSGVVLDARAIHDVGWTVANSDRWPHWYEGNPFRAIRAESADMRP